MWNLEVSRNMYEVTLFKSPNTTLKAGQNPVKYDAHNKKSSEIANRDNLRAGDNEQTLQGDKIEVLSPPFQSQKHLGGLFSKKGWW